MLHNLHKSMLYVWHIYKSRNCHNLQVLKSFQIILSNKLQDLGYHMGKGDVILSMIMSHGTRWCNLAHCRLIGLSLNVLPTVSTYSQDKACTLHQFFYIWILVKMARIWFCFIYVCWFGCLISYGMHTWGGDLP